MLFLHPWKARGFVSIFSKLRVIWSIGISIQLQITSRKFCTNCMNPKQSFNDVELSPKSSLSCVHTADTSIYSTGTYNPRYHLHWMQREAKKLGVRECTKNPTEERIGLDSHGVRRKKKGQIQNCFRITGKVKDTGCFLVKHMKKGDTKVRDHGRGAKPDWMTEMECSDKKKKKPFCNWHKTLHREWNERKSGKKSRQEIRKENEKQGVKITHWTWKMSSGIGLI